MNDQQSTMRETLNLLNSVATGKRILNEGRVGQIADDLESLDDAEFQKEYGKTKAEARKEFSGGEKSEVKEESQDPNIARAYRMGYECYKRYSDDRDEANRALKTIPEQYRETWIRGYHDGETLPQSVDEARTEVKDKSGKVASWRDESDWKKSDKKDPRGKVTHMSDAARRETEKLKKDVAEGSDDYRVTWTEAGKKHTTGLLPKTHAVDSAKKLQKKSGTSDVKVVPYQGVAEGRSKQFEIIYREQNGDRKRKTVSGTSKEAVARQFKKQHKLEIEQVKQLEQGVAEGEGMSRAAKGYEKYGQAGMQALAKAGREGAGEEKLDTIRNRFDRYDEEIEEGKTGPGLWANIRDKKERIKGGSGEKMRKPGSKGAPTAANLKAAQYEGVAEDRPDVMRHAGDKTVRVVKRGGKPVGEIGIDDGPGGNGDYYIKLYDGSYDAAGFDTAEEALEELRYAVKSSR